MSTQTAVVANGWEAAARERKAVRLADLMESYSINAAMAETMEDSDWSRLAKAAGERAVPSQATRLLILARLRSRAVPVNPATGKPMLLTAPPQCATCTGVVLGTPGDFEPADWCTCPPPALAPVQALDRKPWRACSFCETGGYGFDLEAHTCPEREAFNARGAEQRARDKAEQDARMAERARRDFAAIDGRAAEKRAALVAEVAGGFTCAVCVRRCEPEEISNGAYGSSVCARCARDFSTYGTD